MYSIIARNVNQALAMALTMIEAHGAKETSRNGDVLVFPEPVTITYTHPTERVLFSPARDANPFFHFFESLWMLAGRNDIAFPTYFNKNFATYTDDGVTHPGAYGYRWRKSFGYDQLEMLITELKQEPNTRRAVLSMWDATKWESGGQDDLWRKTRDKPCNTHAYFDRRGERLNLTVCQRSGDLWWGTLGANAVQFSTLLEFMSFAVGCPVGEYRHFCNNLHAYTAVVPPAQLLILAHDAEEHDYYPLPRFPLINTSIQTWETDLLKFMDAPRQDGRNYTDKFFEEVASPMYRSWWVRKEKQGTGLTEAQAIAASDWRRACCEWIERREK